jgi:hypothetical protein
MTHVRLSAVSEDVLRGALHVAWKLRVDANAKVNKPPKRLKKVSRANKRK